MVKRTPIGGLSLSFLDVMSCGLGAVVLLFLIMKHHAETGHTSPLATSNQQSEVTRL